MVEDQEVTGGLLSAVTHSPLLCRGQQDVGGSTRHEWESFECIFHLTKANEPTFTLRVGEGDREEVKYGTLPRLSGPLSAEVPIVFAVVPCWRGVYSRYFYDSYKRVIRLQVSGEVYVNGEAGSDSFTWEKAVLLKSWLTVASYYLDAVAFLHVQPNTPLGNEE